MKLSLVLQLAMEASLLWGLVGCETTALHRGYRLFRRGNLPLAIQQWSYYLDHSDDRRDNQEAKAVAYGYRGLAFSMQGNSEAALHDYHEALTRAPDFFYASFNAGVEHLRLEQYDFARICFSNAWISVQKAHRGQLNDSLLWNRKEFARDRQYAFYYYGMSLAEAGRFDTLRTLLVDLGDTRFVNGEIARAHSRFQRFVSDISAQKEADKFWREWIKRMERRRFRQCR